MLNLTQTGPYGQHRDATRDATAVHKKNVTSAGAAPSTGQASNRETKLDDIDTHAACGGAGHATMAAVTSKQFRSGILILAVSSIRLFADLSHAVARRSPLPDSPELSRSESEFSLPRFGRETNHRRPRRVRRKPAASARSPLPHRRGRQLHPGKTRAASVPLGGAATRFEGTVRSAAFSPPSELAYSSTRPSRLANTLRDRCSWACAVSATIGRCAPVISRGAALSYRLPSRPVRASGDPAAACRSAVRPGTPRFQAVRSH